MSDLDLLLAAADDSPSRPADIPAVSPSPYQERLWRAHLAAPDTAYSVPVVFDIDASAAEDVIAAIAAVLRVRDVFATRIVDAENGFVLAATEEVRPEIRDVVDPDDPAELDAATEEILRRPWTDGPLVRVALLRRAGNLARVVQVFHHAVIDGHSVSLLVEDIARELSSPGHAGRSHPVRYHDVARVRPESSAWWRVYLAAVPHRQARRLAETGAPVVTRRGVASAGAPDSAAWLAAVAVTLSRMLDARVLCLSVPLANRREVEEFDVVGPLVSTVPLVIDVAESDTVGNVRRRIERLLADAAANADVDLASVYADIRREDPEFWLPTDIFVNIQSADRSAITLGDAVAYPVAVHTGEMKAPLTISISATAAPEVQIESALSGWSAVTHDGIRDVLEAVVRADPDTSIADVVVGPTGAPKILPTSDTSIVAALVRAADTEQTALVAPDRTLTHTELAREIRGRAAVLVEHGVGAGDSVLLSVERDAAFVSWAAAIMALGAAYVPVDTRHGAARLSAIAQQSGARLCVLSDASVAPEDLRILDRATAPSELSTALPELDSTLPAYVIFTSGTTGVPKGVPVTHANLLALRDATTTLIEPGDIVSAVHAFTFDFSVWELWTALSRGARVVMYDDTVVRDPFVLADRLREDRVTVLSLTNTALGSLLAARPDLPSVRRVVLGGEQVSSAYVRQWFDTISDAAVVNMLGATETTVHTTRRFVTAADLNSPTVQVGEPLAHLDVVIVDDNGRALPRGVAGQITVRGAGLALGYLGRGALTASRFVPDPFPGALPGARLYLTGDLGHWLAPGELQFEGRIDSQVKVRGHRIEASGVETVLEQSPGVRRACVVAHENQLLAFVDSDEFDAGELQSAAAASLAAYEVPDRIHRVRSFPVTVNGKLDRRIESLLAAAGPEDEKPSSAGSFESLVDSVLGDRVVDLDRSFLANGGDSILAVRLVSDIRARGIDLGVGDVLGAATLRSIGELAAARAPQLVAADVVIAPFELIESSVRDALPYDISDAYPLSAAQEGMLFHIRADASVGVYHNTVSIRIRGGLEPLAFRVALADVIRRHEVLRTSIDEWSALEPLQLVHRHASTPLTVVTVGADADPDVVIDDLVAQERVRPFDLERAPLFRITLVRVAPGEDQLIISDSHVVLDGWSWTSTLAEIIDRHNALRRRDPNYDASITAVPVKFVDFVAAEQHARASQDTADAWTDHLRGVRPRVVADVGATGARAMQRTEFDAAALGPRAESAGLSVRHLALAVHVRAMSEVFGAAEIVTGVTSNGRLEREGGIDARGMFLNMIPLQLSSLDDPIAAAEHIARTDAAMVPHRRLPNVDITALAGKGPLFDFGFNFVRFHRLAEVERTHTFGSKDTDSHFSQEDTDFTLMATFSIHPPEHRLALMLIVDTARVSPARQRRIVDAYNAALRWATQPGTEDRGETTQ